MIPGPIFAAVKGFKAGEVYQAPLFICPKCGNDDNAVRWECATDNLNCTCGRCGYQRIRAPLDDRPESEEEEE